ncbi:hypothetical protein [Mycobacterium sp. 1423905.2]|uniref:hypothetical protein n=1 Tax=Mycobacterium sp. 1423905.2 TaxID=1856859 RepID=UPI0008024F40|nr:hypothetical protein [Mycobacterium sp. 1423905.2]OBJ62785.1 hypothetical protein A9W95_07875 [Mycobacterium sp. 1423905.2]
MRLVTEAGLWSTGPTEPLQTPSPLLAVLEVSGAVLSWTIDEPAEAIRITFTDVTRADWLWRVVGESGHVAVTAAVTSVDEQDSPSVELTDVDVAVGPLAALRRLALGHWLRRWWPASQRDDIAALDRALLDVEVALLTSGAQDFFTDDTLDSDVTGLLEPHAAALIGHLYTGDPRIRDLIAAAAELADELGLDYGGWAELSDAVHDSAAPSALATGHRDDYALAAGTDPRAPGAIAQGVASINWGAVPPGIFDAAEQTVDWRVESAGQDVVAIVRAAVIGPDPATGVPVAVRSGDVSGSGALAADGRATVPILDAQRRPITETAAWGHDWPATSVVVGAAIEESPQTRDRVRRWAGARLDQPPQDAFLAEALASESAY